MADDDRSAAGPSEPVEGALEITRQEIQDQRSKINAETLAAETDKDLLKRCIEPSTCFARKRCSCSSNSNPKVHCRAATTLACVGAWVIIGCALLPVCSAHHAVVAHADVPQEAGHLALCVVVVGCMLVDRVQRLPVRPAVPIVSALLLRACAPSPNE